MHGQGAASRTLEGVHDTWIRSMLHQFRGSTAFVQKTQDCQSSKWQSLLIGVDSCLENSAFPHIDH